MIDKNSFLGGVNIQRREMRVKGILGNFRQIFAQDFGSQNKFAPGKGFKLLAIGVGEKGPRLTDEGTVLKL